jgi:outer membrane protein OmpA-like peptidoglycan-associated protein
VTLLPEDNKYPTAVVVQVQGNTQTLSAPYQTVTASPDGQQKSGQTSAAAVRWFGPDLSSQVPAADRLNLYFEAGGVVLTADSALHFQDFLNRYKERNDVDFMVIGHTDRVGSAQANEALSLRRAQAIKKQLDSQGFVPERSQAFGMGELRPLVPTEDEVPETANRRVELVAR